MRRLIGLCWLMAVGALSAQGQRTYVNGSELASGFWVKASMPSAGVYRLDRTWLQQAGFQVASLDPRLIRVHGHAGGPLPQANADPNPDDLPELPLLAVGQDDGRLDEADYFLFYTRGPHTWRWTGTRFEVMTHPYEDSSFVFITLGNRGGARLASVAPGEGGTPLQLVQGLISRDEAQQNVERSGRMWLADALTVSTTSRTYTFDLPGYAAGNAPRMRLRTAARSASNSATTLRADGTTIGTINYSAVNLTSVTADFASLRTADYTLPATAQSRLALELSYNVAGGGTAWLEFVELSYPARLGAATNIPFYLAPGTIAPARVQLGTPLTAGRTLWEVTDPQQPHLQQVQNAGGVEEFTTITDRTRAWVVADGATAAAPRLVGPVANQNLHALGATDYLVITAPAYLAAAEDLAAFHQVWYGRRTAVVTAQQVYHEFSGGSTDMTAFRNLIRMLYDRAAAPEDRPRWVTLLGDGSFDNLRLNPATELPTYQSRNSLTPTRTYTSDDYLAFLENDEGYWGEQTFLEPEDNRLDIYDLEVAVGRLPVRSATEALAVVEKIKTYAMEPATRGIAPWRSSMLLVGDYRTGEGDLHTEQADSLGALVRRLEPRVVLEKVYLDQFPSTTTGSELRFPQARVAVEDGLDRGALLVNYTGHGSSTVLSGSQMVDPALAGGLLNAGRMAFWVTATCEFGRWDDNTVRSTAEDLLARPMTGAIGLMSSVRLVYSFPNYLFNLAWYDALWRTDAATGAYPTLGEAFQRAKNASYLTSPTNTRNFSLLADPGLYLASPPNRAAITGLNGQALTGADTLRALQRVEITGQIENAQGTPLSGFQGTALVTVFDKAVVRRTLLSNMPYRVDEAILFRGQAVVANGQFAVQFVVPRDIDLTAGPGRVEVYADAETGTGNDAWGVLTNLTVGGTDPDGAAADQAPPTAQVYLNDRSWRAGTTVEPDPLLLVDVADDLGINPSGLGIGRDLTAVLDGDEANPLVLNSFYQAAPNDPTQGEIRYRLPPLSPGLHTVSVRVWDVAGASTTAETYFTVGENSAFSLSELYTQPNPTRQPLTVGYVHNRPGVAHQWQLGLTTTSGASVAQLNGQLTPTGNRVTLPLPQLGLAAGVYLLELTVTDAEGGQQAHRTARITVVAQ